MRTQLVLLLMLGVFFSQQTSAQHERHERGREGGYRSMSPAVNSAPQSAPQSAPNAAPIIRTPENRSTFEAQAPQNREAPRNEGNRQYHQENRHSGKGHGGRGDHHNHSSSDWNGGTSVYYYPYVPYYPYPDFLAPFRSGYPTAPVEPYNNYPPAPVEQKNNYPDRYFVCYQANQVGGGLYRISCPYPVSWYSTSPEYGSYEYQASYQPKFVCPNKGADEYVEFDSSDAAIGWANRFCNQVVNQQNLP